MIFLRRDLPRPTLTELLLMVRGYMEIVEMKKSIVYIVTGGDIKFILQSLKAYAFAQRFLKEIWFNVNRRFDSGSVKSYGVKSLNNTLEYKT